MGRRNRLRIERINQGEEKSIAEMRHEQKEQEEQVNAPNKRGEGEVPGKTES